MKKVIKKALAVLLTVTLVIPWIGEVAKAADNYTMSYYTKRNNNPSDGNYFSFEYFDTYDYSFKLLDQYVEETNANNNYWRLSTDNNVLVKGWTQKTTSSKYLTVRFKAQYDGLITAIPESASRDGKFTNASGEFMIVQKGEEGYSPIWPTKGAWKWESVAKDSATSFCPSGISAYVKQGDELLFLVRSSSASTATSVNLAYKITLTAATQDTGSLRPTTWDSYFKGADDKLTTGNFKSSPYVKKATNVDTEPFTKEYITSTAGLQKLDKHIEDASNPYWQLSTNANVEIKPWYMKATANAYNATVYNAQENGYVRFTNSYQLFTSGDTGTYDNAEAMLVLKGTNGYYPVWPKAGKWEWKDVPTGSATAGVPIDVTTYMKEGDKLALVVRSSNTTKGVTWMQSDCSAYMTPIANDYRGLYPPTNAFSATFEGYEWRMPLGPYTEQEQSWHMQKESSDVFTAEYNVGNGFVQMEKFISDANPKYWQSENGQAMIKTYMQTATANTHSAVVFHVPTTGYLKVENAYKPIYTHYSSSGAYEPAQLIIVQKSTDGSGKEVWSPIWPNRGEWKYETLPMRTSNDDTSAGIELKATTYAKAGDEIYFVSRSGLQSTGSTAIQSNLEVFYMESATDDGNLYPTVWSDSYQYAKAEVEFETELAGVTIAAEEGQIRELLKYRPVFKDDDRANPIFNNVPEELIGKSFIATDCWGDSVGWTKTATATTDGWVYAFVTNSKSSKVIADGFKYVPLDITDLFFSANANGSDNCKLYKKYVNAGDTITIYDRWMVLVFETLKDKTTYTQSDSFMPPEVIFAGEAGSENFAKADRQWQGCVGTVQTSDDVMYAAWVTGGPYETAAGNYELFMRSTDGGDTWEEYMYMVPNSLTTVNKVSDAAFHFAEDGSLWLFISSTRNGNNYHGIWVMRTGNPNDENPTWSEPRWICPGVLNTKITVLKDGTWIMPTMALHHDTDYTDIWASDDQGETWHLRGMAYVPETYVDEACIVELNDGRLWLTVRSTTDRGIEESYSSDGGYTWTSGEQSELNGPGSKFIVQRLESGNLLLINHYDYMGRDHMAALLSTDDGKTWPHVLMLDERTTSYPYVTTWNYNGTEVITVMYDHERYDAKQIYTARFTEEDIINGSFSSKYARDKYLIDSLSGDALFDYNNSWFVQQNTNPYTWGYCTYGYFDGNAFKTMEKYVAEADGVRAHWQSASGESKVTDWRVFGTKNETPTISFFIGKSGYLEISEDAANPLQTNGVDGQFMIVQVNGEGEYCPLYPSRGKWEWKDISAEPTNIGTIRTYMNSDDRVILLWKTAGTSNIAVETQAHFKFTYSSTDTEDIYADYTWTRWLGGGALEANQTKADEVSAQMKALAGITLADEDAVKAVRTAYENLTATQKDLVEGMEYLEAAEQKITNLKKGINCVTYLETMKAALPEKLSENNVEAYQQVRAAYKMLTDTEKNMLADKDSYDALVEKLNSYLTSSEKVQRVEDLINEIPLPYELTNRKYLEKAYGAFKELTAKEQEMVKNRAFLQALRRITGLKDSSQNLPNYLVALIDVLPAVDDITLADIYDVEYALGFYTALTEAQQGSVTNYATLQAAVEKINKLQAQSCKFIGMTLSLDGTISFNFYVNKENTLGKDAYVTFVLPNGIQRVSIVEAVETSNGLKFTCSVPAKEMADTVVATLYNGGVEIDTQSVSVRDYAEVILKNDSKLEAYAAAGPLVQAMLNYGAYAQKLFQYNLLDLANKNYADNDAVTSVDINQLAGFAKGQQGLQGFSVLAGASLELKSETTLKLFFEFADNVSLDDLTFTIGGVTQDYTRSGNYYVVDIPNISANNLDKEYTVTVTAGDKTFDARSRAMTFCYNALKNTEDEALKNVAKALYLYNKEADAYFSQYNTANVNRDLFYGVCYCAYEAKVWYGRNVEAEIQAMEEIGATSTRVWMRSSHMMDDPQTIDSNAVATMKEIIADAQGRGIQVIGMNCDWFNGTEDHMAVPERNLEAGSAYMQFLTDYEETWYQLANTFQEIDIWEIGNEWNEDRFLHPLDYKTNGTTFTKSEQAAIATDMLYYASVGIHRANPDAQTVMGGLVDVYEDNYGDAKKFLEMIYTNITSGQWSSQNPDDYFQIAAWHPYNHSGAPDATWVQRQKDIYQVILDYEGHDKVVLFTEIGLSDYGNAETDAGQKDDLITTLTLIRDELSFVQSVHWFRMFDEANAESWGGAFETGFGLFTEPDENGNFELKAKGEAYLEMTGGK